MSVPPAILAKALFDNFADAWDELSFRKGDVITVLEQDVDGLIGWWLCSLHGRQGIAPGNRLQEIKRRLEGQPAPQTYESTECFSFEDIDYDVPKSHEVGEDYAVPRGIASPDYDVPNVNKPEGFVHSSKELQELEHQFSNLPVTNSLNDKVNSKQSGTENVLKDQATCDDMYDVPTAHLEDDVPPEIYDMPRKADKEKSYVELFSHETADLYFDDNVSSSAVAMCNSPDQGVSKPVSDSKQPLLVHEEPEIYAEIYDVPAAPSVHEREKVFERPSSQDTNVNKNSVEFNKPRNPQDLVANTLVINSDGKRQSTSSTDSAKLSSEDDDYVDYQDIYGDGRGKDVNVYDVPVQFSLAQMYQDGTGMKKDLKMALSLYEASAKNGIREANTMIGNLHTSGEIGRIDHAKAAKYFTKAAEKGDVSALMTLGAFYRRGTGVEKDDEKSFNCYKAAADQGYLTAQYNIGVNYFAGMGVEHDFKKAAYYFDLAARRGHVLAKINLGNMYYFGYGVDKNWEKSRELYSEAAKENKNAELLLQELEDEMKNLNKTDDPY